jgi:hypothetical protein
MNRVPVVIFQTQASVRSRIRINTQSESEEQRHTYVIIECLHVLEANRRIGKGLSDRARAGTIGNELTMDGGWVSSW